MVFILILAIITGSFFLIRYILIVEERHIREDGAKFEEYVYKRDLRSNKYKQIANFVIYIVIMFLAIVLKIVFWIGGSAWKKL